MKRSLGPKNAAFRYGGDEFVALLPGMGKAAAIGTTMALCEDLRAARFLEGAGLSLQRLGELWAGDVSRGREYGADDPAGGRHDDV